MVEAGVAVAAYNPIILRSRLPLPSTKLVTVAKTTKTWKHNPITTFSSSSSSSSSSSLGTKDRPVRGQLILSLKYNKHDYSCSSRSNIVIGNNDDDYKKKKKRSKSKKDRVFLLDVNPLCYDGSTPSLRSFAYWISFFFSQVSLSDPVIAVFDGEGANEYRRQLLPSYKAHRRKFSPQISNTGRFTRTPAVDFHQLISDVLRKCNVPVVKIAAHEADDVIATLAGQALQRGYGVVIASPDKDFKQLISDDVQIVMPIPELKRWSFYTLKHYVAQYNCDPQSDLSLRCIMGDEVDGVPGIQHLVPGFGLKTALKLLKKHHSLENLLNAAAVRTVGKPFVQDALTKYADHLRRNYEVLSLRRDINVLLQEEWLHERNANNDAGSLFDLGKLLGGSHNLNKKSGAHSNG